MFAIAVLIAANAGAQSPYTPVAPIPLGDSLLTLPTSHIPSDGTWEVKFTHRFNQSLNDGAFDDLLHSLFGLDSNAEIGIGFSYTPRRDLQFSLIRTNTLDDVELAVKYVVLQQAPAVPFSVALRGGIDWRTEKDLDDRTSVFAQAVLSRQFGRKAELFVIPTFATNAGRSVTSAGPSTALFDHAFNVPVGFAVMIRPALSVVAEVIPPNRDLPEEIESDLGWAIGLKRAIGGHYFEILVTNSNATHVGQYVTTTFQGTPLKSSNVHLGFNIERRW